jgi:Na+-driven multidrug efflux pump
VFPILPTHALDRRSTYTSFVRLGLSGGVMMALEAWMFEMMTVFAGHVGDVALDAHNILLLIAGFFFLSFPLGISIAATIRVGNLVGAGEASRAKRAVRTHSCTTAPLSVLTAPYSVLLSIALTAIALAAIALTAIALTAIALTAIALAANALTAIALAAIALTALYSTAGKDRYRSWWWVHDMRRSVDVLRTVPIRCSQ